MILEDETGACCEGAFVKAKPEPSVTMDGLHRRCRERVLYEAGSGGFESQSWLIS